MTTVDDRARCLLPGDVLGLHPGDAAEGVAAAVPALRRPGEGAISDASGLRDPTPRGARRAAQRREGHGLHLPAGLLPPRKWAQ